MYEFGEPSSKYSKCHTVIVQPVTSASLHIKILQPLQAQPCSDSADGSERETLGCGK